MKSYQHFAQIYDELMVHAPYDEWVRFTQKILEKNQKKVKEIVDLGCGTAEIALRLVSEGYRVIGVDQSTEMLAVAHEKVLKAGTHLTLIQQDIRQLEGFQEVELFISYCDVMNYITNKNDLQAVFSNVYASLAKEGLFIFDIHSLAYVKRQLLHHTFADMTDELGYIWHCLPGNDEGEMYHQMTFFQQSASADQYIRFDETHHQQTFELEQYKQLLKSCGFTKITFYSDFMIENDFSEKNSDRIFILAQK